MRCFVAVPIPADVQERLGALVNDLRPQAPTVTWVREGHFHVTLKFLGEAAESGLPAIGRRLEEAAKGCGPLELTLEGLGTFPPRGTPRVLWAGVRESRGSLPALAGRVDARLAGLGFPPEKRGYSPHLTLGRLKPGRGTFDRSILPEGFSTPRFRVPAIHLYQSILGREGPRYLVLAEILLA